MWVRLAIVGWGAIATLWPLLAGPLSRRISMLSPQMKDAVRREQLADVTRSVMWRAPGAVVAVYAVVAAGPVIGVAAGLTSWTSTSLLIAAVDLRRAERLNESLTMFCVLLSNQAKSAPSVISAVAEAARWSRGAASGAIQRLAEGLNDPGIATAAERFAIELGTPLASQISHTLRLAHGQGFRWAPALEALAETADAGAESLRRIREVATSKFPSIVLSAALSAAMLIAMVQVMPGTRGWYGTTTGQSVMLGITLVFATMCGSLASSVGKEARR